MISIGVLALSFAITQGAQPSEISIPNAEISLWDTSESVNRQMVTCEEIDTQLTVPLNTNEIRAVFQLYADPSFNIPDTQPNRIRGNLRFFDQSSQQVFASSQFVFNFVAAGVYVMYVPQPLQVSLARGLYSARLSLVDSNNQQVLVPDQCIKLNVRPPAGSESVLVRFNAATFIGNGLGGAPALENKEAASAAPAAPANGVCGVIEIASIEPSMILKIFGLLLLLGLFLFGLRIGKNEV